MGTRNLPPETPRYRPASEANAPSHASWSGSALCLLFPHIHPWRSHRAATGPRLREPRDWTEHHVDRSVSVRCQALPKSGRRFTRLTVRVVKCGRASAPVGSEVGTADHLFPRDAASEEHGRGAPRPRPPSCANAVQPFHRRFDNQAPFPRSGNLGHGYVGLIRLGADPSFMLSILRPSRVPRLASGGAFADLFCPGKLIPAFVCARGKRRSLHLRCLSGSPRTYRAPPRDCAVVVRHGKPSGLPSHHRRRR